MKITRLLGRRSLKLINWIGGLFLFVYILSMFVIPPFKYQFDWVQIQNVWDRWQSLNVGVLALLSSIVVLNVSRYTTERKREREFAAARAFLPAELSELIVYCDQSLELFNEAWGNSEGDRIRRTELETPIPIFPPNYREVLKECISLGDTEPSEHLTYILMKLQIHHSRMTSLVRDLRPNSETVVVRLNLLSYFYGVAEIKACIDQIFEFARGTEKFQQKPLTLRNFITAFRTARIHPEGIEGLVPFIERTIERERPPSP